MGDWPPSFLVETSMNLVKLGTAIALAGSVAFPAASFAETLHYNAEGRPPAQQPLSVRPFMLGQEVAYYYTRGLGTDRSINVADFQNPSTGIYCIEPSVSVNFSTVEPLVSIEWSESNGFALLAYWENVAVYTDCPTGYFEVRTYDFNEGGYPVVSSNVAFNLVVR